MNVRTQAYVLGEVPTDMVRIVINYNMDVRSVRVTRSVPIITFFLDLRVWTSNRRRAVGRDVPTASRFSPALLTLGRCRGANQQEHCQDHSEFVHMTPELKKFPDRRWVILC